MVFAEPGIFWEHSQEHRCVLKEPACCNSEASSLKTEGTSTFSKNPPASERWGHRESFLSPPLNCKAGDTVRRQSHWPAEDAVFRNKLVSSEVNNTDSSGRRLYTLLNANCVCPATLLVVYPRGRGWGALDFISLCSICRLFLRAGGTAPVLLGNQQMGLATMSRGRWDKRLIFLNCFWYSRQVAGHKPRNGGRGGGGSQVAGNDASCKQQGPQEDKGRQGPPDWQETTPLGGKGLSPRQRQVGKGGNLRHLEVTFSSLLSLPQDQPHR